MIESIEEIKNELLVRLSTINKKIDDTRKDLGNPYLHHHYEGYLEATDGMFGERQFLEKLLEKIK
jgi:hypothetical protein